MASSNPTSPGADNLKKGLQKLRRRQIIHKIQEFQLPGSSRPFGETQPFVLFQMEYLKLLSVYLLLDNDTDLSTRNDVEKQKTILENGSIPTQEEVDAWNASVDPRYEQRSVTLGPWALLPNIPRDEGHPEFWIKLKIDEARVIVPLFPEQISQRT